MDKFVGRELEYSKPSPEQVKKHLEVTGGKIRTRFPPEPNGYLHLGHAKSMELNFGLAEKEGGMCFLRFDDTNPEAEDLEFYQKIEECVKLMGYWTDDVKVTYASQYFNEMYECAIRLIKKGLAYVDKSDKKAMKEQREKKEDSPYRPKDPVTEEEIQKQIDEFLKMKDGVYKKGEACLRMRINMQHDNPNMRDPVAYRVLYHPHVRSGNDWCIYPSYDFEHCLVDAFEHIDYSLCTLEFENRRESYYWLLDVLDMWKPMVWEFARLNVENVNLSKRKLKALVNDGAVSGWDDPRMFTMMGLRRRGVTPECLKKFCQELGVTRSNSTIQMHIFDNAIRDVLNNSSPRVFAVIKPLKVTLTNFAEITTNEGVEAEAPHFPTKKELGSRKLLLTPTFYIERTDFKDKDEKGFFGLAGDNLSKEVRLKYVSINIKVSKVNKLENGDVESLECVYSPAAADAKAPKGTIHWIGQRKVNGAFVDPVPAVFNLFESPWIKKEEKLTREQEKELARLKKEKSKADPKKGTAAPPPPPPPAVEDDEVRIETMTTFNGFVEEAILERKHFDSVQAERHAYFCVDPLTTAERIVLNETRKIV